MLHEQERSLKQLSPLERQQAQRRSHNMEVLAQHKAQRAAEQAQREQEQREQEQRARPAIYAQSEHDQAQVKAANAAHHGSYQFEPLEEKKRNSRSRKRSAIQRSTPYRPKASP